MFAAARCIRHHPGRLLRPAVALVLVLAHAAAAFGFPVVLRRGETLRVCGCKVNGPSQACCCPPVGCCAPAPVPEPEPEPACPKCVTKSRPAAKSEKPVAVGWALGVAAGTCRGDGPLGLAAEIPAVPPAVPPRTAFSPEPAGSISLGDLFATPLASVPDDPPPRR